MAASYDKSLQTAKAVAAYRNAVRYKQASSSDYLALGRLLLKTGSYKEAAQIFEMVLDSMPDNALAQNGLEAARKAPGFKDAGSRYTVTAIFLFHSQRCSGRRT